MEELAVTSDQIYIFNPSDVNFDIQNPYVYLIDCPPQISATNTSRANSLVFVSPTILNLLIRCCALGEYESYVIFKQSEYFQNQTAIAQSRFVSPACKMQHTIVLFDSWHEFCEHFSYFFSPLAPTLKATTVTILNLSINLICKAV